MKILIINTFYYPKFVGGAEISVQLLAEDLVKAGHQVFILTFGVKRAVERINGVIVVRVKQNNIYSTYNTSKASGLLKVIWHLIDSCNLLNYFSITAFLRRIKPDVVHTNNIQGFSPFIWMIIKKRGIPLVHTLRDYYMICHRNNLYKAGGKCDKLCLSCKITYSVKKAFARYPDCYIGISHFILNKHGKYLSMGASQTGVIYNAVVKPASLYRKRQDSEKLIFGFMGRISKDKGAGYLAEELVKVRQDLRPLFKIIFAGKGNADYLANLQEMLKGIEFEFPGIMDPTRFYEGIDISITPSLWDEPFGRVAIESLSHSVPVILAESGGLKELHNPDCTWSFSPDENKLHPLIEHIVENKQEIILREKHCSEYAHLFSGNKTAQKYIDIYNKINNTG